MCASLDMTVCGCICVEAPKYQILSWVVFCERKEAVCVCVCVCACTCACMFNNSFIVFQAASTVSGGIILTQPYDPRVKKQKLKPYDRKLRLDLLHSDPTSTSKSQDASTSSSTSSVSIGVSGTGFSLVLECESFVLGEISFLL